MTTTRDLTVNYCIIIPHYNHAKQLLNFLPKLQQLGYTCIIVDDGSNEQNRALACDFIQSQNNIFWFEHGYNRGKGAAFKTAINHARALKFTHALQIDADGQHNPEDINNFIEQSKQFPQSIISGKPIFDQYAPKARVYGRKITDFFVAIETFSLTIKDSLCGFRVYPIASTEKIIDHFYIGSRMDFDTEILVKACWLNIPLRFINTKVIYPEQGISHFNYLRDNSLLIRLHTRLLFGMVIRLPKLTTNIYHRAILKNKNHKS